MRINLNLFLVLLEVLDGIGRSRVALEARHDEHFGKVVRGDFFDSGESEVLKAQVSTSFQSY